MYQQYITLSKEYISDAKEKAKPMVVDMQPLLPFDPNKLSMLHQMELTKRCDNIVSFFPDPYAVPMAVRTRLHNVMQSLKTAPEQQFILDYMDEHFPVEGSS